MMLNRSILCAALFFLRAPFCFAQHGPAADRAATAGMVPAEGLKLELFASDPLLFNPVAFSIDEKGRFFISESHRWKDSIFDLWTKDDHWKLADFASTTVQDRERFLRQEFATNLTRLTKDSEIIRLVEDKDGDGFADASSVFADEFNSIVSGTAAGVLASEGNLWFTCIPDLWKFTYDYAGKVTSREVLHTGYGVHTSVSGHDLHGLVQGLDGRIYYSVGDRGANVTSKEGEQVESITCGAVFRCEPDGSHLEIVAKGLRNPQELAFDEWGNLFAHDNDTSGEDPPRVMEIVEGGDYGWRQSYQFMTDFGPWVKEKLWEGSLDDVLPAAGFGAQGPSGLAAYPGVGLPEKYRGALLACDFPQGVWAYYFTPRGASFELRKEHFLWGLGPTDVAFGPDCNVYVSDWGRSYNMPEAGRLLRVFSPVNKTNVTSAEVKQLLGQGMSGRPARELAQLLSHADMRVRTAAQFELERRCAASAENLSLIAGAARQLTNRRARVHAIWALGNLGRRGVASSSPTLLLSLAADSDPEIRAQVARQLREFAPDTKVQEALVDLLKDASPRVQMFAALSLAHASSAQATEPLFNLCARDEGKDAYVRNAAVYALVENHDLAGIRAAGKSTNSYVRRASMLCFRRLKSPDAAAFLEDVDAIVRRNAARAINDAPIPEALPALAARLADNAESDPQILLRALNANFRLGTAEDWNRVLAFASQTNAPEDLRAEAFSSLADWTRPSPLDRVVGLWRPVTGPRETGDINELSKAVTQSLRVGRSQLKAVAITCAEKLRLESTFPALVEALRNGANSIAIRTQALRALGTVDAAQLNDAVQFALRDSQTALRAEAVSWLPEIAPDTAMGFIRSIITSERDISMQQQALAAAGRVADPSADEFLSGRLDELIAGRLDELIAGRLRPELALDVLEAARNRSSAELKAKIESYDSRTAASGPLAPYKVSLYGGNAWRGNKLFHENDAIGCLRCHAIKGAGGIVGPDLAGVATRRNREYLLESIVLPNAQIAPGFESANIVLKNGENHAGTVKSETANGLVLSSIEDGDLTIKKSDIAQRVRTLSPMPEGLAQLISRAELRDLVEYLSTLH